MMLTVFLDGPSKAALIHLTKQQAGRLAPKGIMINVICPGFFPSRMTKYAAENHHDDMVKRQPTGRYGQAGDFGGLVLFLCSQAAAHMTGNVLELDGGAMVSGWTYKGKDGGEKKEEDGKDTKGESKL